MSNPMRKLHPATIVAVVVLSLFGVCGTLGMIMVIDQVGIPLFVPIVLAIGYFIGVIAVGVLVDMKMGGGAKED